VRIESSAPTRIDLAGGTLDIWPLYLFHDDAQTINIAISLRAWCVLSGRDDGRVTIRSRDTGASLNVADWRELSDGGELRLVSRILRFFRLNGIAVETGSDSPFGAGIAGSSALNIALCSACAHWAGRTLTADELFTIAMNVEAQAIDVPTGVQDYRPALYGGISAVELHVDGVRRIPIPVDPFELQRRIVLAYTMASRNSGINNWEVTKRHIDRDPDVVRHFALIRDIAGRMRAALGVQDWDAVAREIAAEWENRKQLAPGVTTPAIEALLALARRAGARAGKVCGAGGGGCLICFCDPDAAPAVREALASGGARVLDYEIDMRGLVVDEK
jgi:D-glycero-alpha-D-manno-heptose-7-phosphate kinase